MHSEGQPAPAASDPTASDTAPDESRVRVFLVDDHELVRRGLRDLLSTADDIEVVDLNPDDLIERLKAGKVSRG